MCQELTPAKPFQGAYKIKSMHKNQQTIIPPILLSNGAHTTNREDSIRTIISEILPKKDDSNTTWQVDVEALSPSDVLITQEEIITTFNTIKSRTAMGLDGLNFKTTKILITEILPLIHMLFNVCLVQGVFPTIWKKGKLSLLLKAKTDPAEPNSYRPLCVLPILTRVFEKIIFKRLYHYCDINQILHTQQYGSRHGSSSVHILHKITSQLRETRASGAHSILVSLHVHGAFNSLKHHIIRETLQNTKCPNNLYHLIDNFLQNRLGIVLSKGEI